MSAASARRCRLRKYRRGECERCAQPVSQGTTLCEAHRVSRRAYCRAWRVQAAEFEKMRRLLDELGV